MKITDVEAIVLRYRDEIQDIADGTQDALIVRVIPNALFLEFVVWDSPLAHELVQPRFWIERDGTVAVPEGPGLGITLDEAVLRRYRVA